jgi:hypothetical protein
MNIKIRIQKLKRKIKYLFLTDTEKRMMSLSAKITDEYIHNREFRRLIKKCGFDDTINKMLEEWETKNQSF